MTEPSNPSELFVRAHRERLQGYVSKAWLTYRAAQLRGDTVTADEAFRELTLAQRALTLFNLEHGEGPALERAGRAA